MAFLNSCLFGAYLYLIPMIGTAKSQHDAVFSIDMFASFYVSVG